MTYREKIEIAKSIPAEGLERVIRKYESDLTRYSEKAKRHQRAAEKLPFFYELRNLKKEGA